jgi:hypothetical protein
MKRTFLAIIFVSIPVLAVAGFPKTEDVDISGDAVATDVINPALFNAVERTVALELRCHPDCVSDLRAPDAD